MFSRTLPGFGFLTTMLIWLAGCSSKPSQDQPVVRSDQSAVPVAASPVKTNTTTEARPGTPLGSLKGRDHVLTFYSTLEGARFTVSTLDGKVLGEQMSVEELRAQLPDVYKAFKSSIAGTGTYQDASAPRQSSPPQRPVLDASMGLDASR